MDRCEHNDKVIKFCASECCVWKDSAGCPTCMRKYHNHVGPSTFVEERDIEGMLKKFKADSSVKPKFKALEEYIRTYFNMVRDECVKYFEQFDRRIRTELCYPYLTRSGHVQVYKKLKKKEYKRVAQKEFRAFYEITQKINPQEFIKQERAFYEEAITRYQITMKEVFNVMGDLESKLNTIDKTLPFKLDKTHQIKIQNVFDMVTSGKVSTMPSQEAFEYREQPQQLSNTLQIPTDTMRSRTKSIEASISERPDARMDQQRQSSDYNKKERQLSEMKKKLLNMMATEKPKKMTPPKVKDTSYTKSSLQSTETQFYRILEPQKPKVSQDLNSSINDDSRIKRNYLSVDDGKDASTSNKSINLTDNLLRIPLARQISEVKHNKLPSQETEQTLLQAQRKPPSPKKNPNLRAVVVPVKAEVKIEPSEYSPLLRKIAKRQQDAQKQSGFSLIAKPVPQVTSDKNLKIEKKKSEDKPQHVLTANQKSSVELLTESLKKCTEQAIPLLQKALNLTPNNLSAAQYLSFLLLETNQPMQCLKVCNSIIEILEGDTLYDVNSMHIHINKAVALIMLGRFSQAIPPLQRCLQVKETDRLYKNLADAFFQLGIPQKAVYNYEKAIALNPKSAEAHYNLAVCLYTQQNYYNALHCIDKALLLAPNNEDYKQLKQQTKLKV